MTPIAGMEFLALHDQDVGIAILIIAEIHKGHVRKALLFIYREFMNDLQAFGFALLHETCWIVAVGSAVIHVDVKVGSYPGSGCSGVKPSGSNVTPTSLILPAITSTCFRNGFTSNPPITWTV